ncbi:MAG: delta-60 repeat domain-containing protein, partial [Chloroflexaceae bacterium]|nr:delta-60 repeat domain-containing protein [Chloroflexaceae bacterium]
MRVQPDGKVVATGSFSTFNGQPRRGITRLNSDGTLDLAFNPGTGFAGPVPTTQVTGIALQPDGRLVISGDFTRFNDVPRGGIARLNADGSLDSSFEPASGANGYVIDLALQPDGTIVIGGDFTSVNGTPQGRLARLQGNETSATPTVVWQAGDVGERSIVLQLVNDGLPEWDETLVLAFTPSGGATVGEPARMTLTIQSVDRPDLVATPKSITGEENGDLVIQLSSNMPATEPALYRLTSLPEQGRLFQYDNGNRGAEISSVPTLVSDPEGRLIFAPVPDTIGTPYASFGFEV